jgi:hypothetical protein
VTALAGRKRIDAGTEHERTGTSPAGLPLDRVRSHQPHHAKRSLADPRAHDKATATVAQHVAALAAPPDLQTIQWTPSAANRSRS